jgi:hypothetical protein
VACIEHPQTPKEPRAIAACNAWATRQLNIRAEQPQTGTLSTLVHTHPTLAGHNTPSSRRGHPLALKVDVARVLVKHHILQHRPKPHRAPDVRLVLLRMRRRLIQASCAIALWDEGCEHERLSEVLAVFIAGGRIESAWRGRGRQSTSPGCSRVCASAPSIVLQTPSCQRHNSNKQQQTHRREGQSTVVAPT